MSLFLSPQKIQRTDLKFWVIPWNWPSEPHKPPSATLNIDSSALWWPNVPDTQVQLHQESSLQAR